MAQIKRYLSIEKRDDAKRIVEGYASSEDVDLQGGVWQGTPYEGDVVSADAIEKALPEFMEYGNVREMHREDSAVGVILKADIIRGTVELSDGRKLTNPLHVIAKIADTAAWEKVVSGVYKGFSIQADVFKLRLTKIANRVVRLIQSLRLTEISLVDRPANPGAKIILWKGANMAKQTSVQKAADPQKVIAMLQELRDAAELEGDLERAGQFTSAIALAMQANGAAETVSAEPVEESEAEHAVLGEEETPAEGAAETPEEPARPSEEETAKGLESLNSEQPAEKGGEAKPEDKPEDDKTKKAAVANIAAVGVIDVVSKTELSAIGDRVDHLGKAFSGDIARIAKAIEDLGDQVDALKNRPVLKEIPFQVNGAGVPNFDGQTVEIMKSMRDDPQTPPGMREMIDNKIVEMQIRGAKPNYVGYTR